MSDQQLAAGGQVGEQWENELAEQPPLMAWQATTYNAVGKRRTTGGQPVNKIGNLLQNNKLRGRRKKGGRWSVGEDDRGVLRSRESDGGEADQS